MEVERTCPVCGVTYKAELRRLKFGRQTTCSRVCSYKLRGRNLSKQIEFTCALCGQKFNRAPSQIKGKYNHNFCSRKCHYASRETGLTPRIINKPYQISEEARIAWKKGGKKMRKTRIARNNYGHTEATKAILSQKTAQAISEGRVPKRSKLEDKVALYLTSININFIAQKPVRDSGGRYAAVFDFFIPERNIVIEVQGRFWHADPRFFPDGPIHPIQKRNAIAWKRKLSIAAELGIVVHEIWEDDINHDISQTISAVLG